VKQLPAPERGNRIYYDLVVHGFGARVTAAGARSFVLNYRTRATSRERRYTIGSFPLWTTARARKEAKCLKQEIDAGYDPLAFLEAEREAPTVEDLSARYVEEHMPRKGQRSQKEDERLLLIILDELKRDKVADVRFSEVDALHRKVTRERGPYRANRVLALLSKMFSLSIRWGWRLDNPCIGVERNQEHKRIRYLNHEELGRLTAALEAHGDQQAANVVRLLLMTGARSGEVLSATWGQFDLEAGIWTKPATTTKQRVEHRVPLSAPARTLLVKLKSAFGKKATFVFPGPGGLEYRHDIRHAWDRICKEAKITGLRIHDLRHSYASFLASAGLSLPVIGALLGHREATTTQRYAHLLDDPLRQATERVGALVAGKRAATVLPLKGRA
jgi:integrase